MVEVIMPPTIGAAIGFITSEPIPDSQRVGIRLARTAQTVMSFGRKRWTAPSTAAASTSPSVKGLLGASTASEVDVIGTGGSLSVSQKRPSYSVPVNLTSEGTADWILFRSDFNDGCRTTVPTTGVIRKAGVSPLISSANPLRGMEKWGEEGAAVGFSFSDGTSDPQEDNLSCALYTGNAIAASDLGFGFTVKADTIQRTLRLYVGTGDGARGKLRAYLSDGSAPILVDSSLQKDPNNDYYATTVYTIHFSAASPGQTLNVRWTLDAVDTFSGTPLWGEIDLYAATLDGTPVVPIGPAIAAISPISGTVGTQVTITGSGFGAGQGSNAVTFNGVAAVPSSWSETQIQAQAPAGASSGNVAVTVAGVASDGVYFTMPIGPSLPTITWAAPAAIIYGTPLSTTQLNATASVPGAFVYTPAAGTELTAGSTTLSMTFTPTDTTDYTVATAQVPLTIAQAMPTVTWAAPAPIFATGAICL